NATPELLERFGPNRVIDTPISELAFAGAAFGAAVRGLRPVVEIMFADFLGLVLDTVANQASKYWYLSNGQASVPYTIRTTIAAGLRMFRPPLAAAAELAAGGIEAEVIDLRSLRPFDIDAIAESAGRTGALVAVEEGPPTGGYASEVISAVAERDRSVRVARVTMPDLPIPFSGVLEDAVVPQPPNVVAAVRKLIGERGE